LDVEHVKKTHTLIKVYAKNQLHIMQSTYSWLQGQNNKLSYISHELKYSLQKQVKFGINTGRIT